MIKKQFWRYVLPSMIAFSFSGIYGIVDGFFVGRSLGDVGLASINIAYPLQAFIQATGAGIGMAGAIGLAISSGRKDKEAEKEYQGNTLLLLLIMSIIVTFTIWITYNPILELFGAKGETLEYAKSYIRIIIFGAVFQIFGTGLIPIIRNNGGAFATMIAMLVGFIVNVGLDWLLVYVYHFGTGGAAVATIAGQAASCILSILYLIFKVRIYRHVKFSLFSKCFKNILVTAISPFGLTLTPNVVIIIINKGASVYGGDEAVSTYAVISYVVSVVHLLLQGIGDGAQPLIGRYHGSREKNSLKSVLKLAYQAAFGITGFCMIALYILRETVPLLFGVSQGTLLMYKQVILYFIAGLLFTAFLRITTSYFYAIRMNKSAYILIYGEPILLAILVGIIIPKLVGLNGVWIAVPITQVCLAFIGFILLREKVRMSKISNNNEIK
jgi:putative MATE family efflux protein